MSNSNGTTCKQLPGALFGLARWWIEDGLGPSLIARSFSNPCTGILAIATSAALPKRLHSLNIFSPSITSSSYPACRRAIAIHTRLLWHYIRRVYPYIPSSRLTERCRADSRPRIFSTTTSWREADTRLYTLTKLPESGYYAPASLNLILRTYYLQYTSIGTIDASTSLESCDFRFHQIGRASCRERVF